MKVIINIPDNVYANLMEYCEHHGIVEAVYGYIYHGTPIPDNATVCNIEQIRAEIEELDTHYDNDYFSGNKDPMYKCNDVLQIIDKYKAEEGD